MQRKECTPLAESQPYNPLNINIISGVLTGTFCTGLLNPWDRALYLAIKHNRKFLLLENFRRPYQGLSQAVLQRGLFGSAYYIAQGEIQGSIYPYLRNVLLMNDVSANFAVGSTAGSINGVMTNSIAAIKYHRWGRDNHKFFASVAEMWRKGGAQPFVKGTKATVARDMVFGVTYEVLRHQMLMATRRFTPEDNHPGVTQFVSNSVAAGIATVASGPLNYVRSMQYATPPSETPLAIHKILIDVWRESREFSPQTAAQIGFFQRRFQIGWGTARVAVGMALGQKIFDMAREVVSSQVAKKN